MKLDRINIICTFNKKFVSIHLTIGFVDDLLNSPSMNIQIIIRIIFRIVAVVTHIEYKSSFIARIAFPTTRSAYYFPIPNRIPRYMITIALQLNKEHSRSQIWLYREWQSKRKLFTCRTANIMENIVMINKQMATAIAVIAVSGESRRKANEPLLPSSVIAVRSMFLKILSDPTTVRRLPAVETVLHSPEMQIKSTAVKATKPHFINNVYLCPCRNDNSSQIQFHYHQRFYSDSRARIGYSIDPNVAEERMPYTSTDRGQNTTGTNRGSSCTSVLLYHSTGNSSIPCKVRHRA